MYNEDKKIIDKLEHFDELDFFLKKYNGIWNNIELAQVVFQRKELERYNECATYLKYAIFKNKKNEIEKKLIHANFCKNRWCSVCNWRRALKYRHILNNRIKKIKEEKKVKFIFVTFTIKNTYYKFLKRDLKLLLNSFKRLVNYSEIKNNKAILGYVRSLEFTVQKSDINYINLHIHTLFAVSTSYFNSSYDFYLNQKKWTELWQKALRVDYMPVVDVRLVKKRKKSKYSADELAVFEIVKYILKDTDLFRLQEAKRIDIFRELYKSLKNVRNLGFGGIFAPKNFKKDNEKKEEDLIHITNDNDVKGELLGEAVYLLKDGFYRLQKFEEKE